MINTFRPYHVVLAACLLYLTVIGLTFRDPLEFVYIGSNFDSSLYSRSAEGYDGQFAYFIARDSTNAAARLDVPAYRYQRILLPALTWVGSLGGRPELLPFALVGVNLLALVAGTALLETLLRTHNASRWYALSYGLFAGVFVAVRFSTNEPLAYGLVIAALLAAERKRLLTFALLMALTALAKETTLLFTGGYLLYLLSERRLRDTVRVGIVALLPFTLWQAILYQKFGAFGVGSGGANATPFEIIPFNGIWKIAPYGLSIFAANAVILFPAVVVPTLWGLYRAARDLFAHRAHPYVYLLLVNAGVMLFVPFSTYREPFGILRFIPGLVICILLYAALRRTQRALNYSLLWSVFGMRVLG